MARDYKRSVVVRQIFEILFTKHRVGLILSFPGLGELRVRGDKALELIWALRAHDGGQETDRWLEETRSTLASFREGQKASSEVLAHE